MFYDGLRVLAQCMDVHGVHEGRILSFEICQVVPNRGAEGGPHG